jgi:BASS family bile acid:Na+ symporter
MTGAGLGLAVRDIIAPLRRARLVAFALLANFAIAPAFAYALTELVPLKPAHANGLLLLGCAAGAPFLPKLVDRARGDAAFAIGLMLLLMVASVVAMPILLPRMIPGLSADPWPLLKPLLLTMLIPLAAGIAVKRGFPVFALLAKPLVVKVSNVSMLIAVVLLFGLNFQAMLGAIGTGAILAGTLFVAVSLFAGYAMGGPLPRTRSVLGLGTGQRNIAAALTIATNNFTDPEVVVMLLATTFAGVVVMLIAARWFAKRTISGA